MKGVSKMKEKVKQWVRSKRMAISAGMMSSMFALMCCASALDGDASSFDLATVMTSSVTQIVNNLMKMIAAVLPITVTLLGAAIGVTYGINFIKRILHGSKG